MEPFPIVLRLVDPCAVPREKRTNVCFYCGGVAMQYCCVRMSSPTVSLTFEYNELNTYCYCFVLA